jgi:hypothetical protein
MASLTRPASPTSDALSRAVLGKTLIAIGAIALAGLLVPAVAPFTMLGVSGALLLAFARTRDYGFAMSGGITGGTGIMIALVSTAIVDPSVVPTILFLSMAAGFASAWLLGMLSLPRETHPWPLVPAGIFATFAVGLAIGHPAIFDSINAVFVGSLLAVGVALVLRRRHA